MPSTVCSQLHSALKQSCHLVLALTWIAVERWSGHKSSNFFFSYHVLFKLFSHFTIFLFSSQYWHIIPYSKSRFCHLLDLWFWQFPVSLHKSISSSAKWGYIIYVTRPLWESINEEAVSRHCLDRVSGSAVLGSLHHCSKPQRKLARKVSSQGR